MNKKTIRNIGIFVFVVIISGWIGVLVDSVLGSQSKSVWPYVILHSVKDSLINLLAISGYISITSGREIIIGVIAAMIYIAVGIRIRAYRRQANSNHKKLLPQIAVLKKVGV